MRLFDLRKQTDAAIKWGLDCLYFLAPHELGDHIAFLVLSSTAYEQLVTWPDIAASTAFRIPRVECWFPGDVPISLLQEVLLIQVVRRPLDPAGLAAIILNIHARHGV